MDDHQKPDCVLHHKWSDSDEFCGRWKALRDAGIVPAELADPPAPRRGGAWLTDADGRRLRIGSYGDGYRVTRSITKEERTERRRIRESARMGEDAAKAAQARLQSIDASLRIWSEHKAQFCVALGNCINDAIENQIRLFAWPDSPHRGPWTFAPNQRKAVGEARALAIALLTRIEMDHDEEWRARLEMERAMLTEDAQSYGSMGDATVALQKMMSAP